jgi:hypothetical protein
VFGIWNKQNEGWVTNDGKSEWPTHSAAQAHLDMLAVTCPRSTSHWEVRLKPVKAHNAASIERTSQ